MSKFSKTVGTYVWRQLGCEVVYTSGKRFSAYTVNRHVFPQPAVSCASFAPASIADHDEFALHVWAALLSVKLRSDGPSAVVILFQLTDMMGCLSLFTALD